ncbi:MAG: VOC family protein [Acidiferrobacter sp.]
MASESPAPALRLGHVALVTEALEAMTEFYGRVFGMRVVWQPDADNVYLSHGHDNLALHRGHRTAGGALDHIGFVVDTPAAVDAWSLRLTACGVTVTAPPKTHRDGARSLYCRDPDGNLIQVLCLSTDP